MRLPLLPTATVSAVLAGIFLSLECAHANDEFKELGTPPEQISVYSEQQLNDLGRRMAEEVYAVLSEVGTSTGKITSQTLSDDDQSVITARSLVADRALIQNARVSHGLTKTTYLPSDIDEFSIDNVVLTQPAHGVLVASYRVALPNRTDTVTGTVMKGEFMPRLTVLQWNDELKQWQVFSHADFDSPMAAVCNKVQERTYARATFDPQDVILGKSIIDDFVKAMIEEKLPDHVLKGYQYVYASGERKTEDGPVRTRITQNVDRINLEAVKSGRLIAIRYDTKGVLTLDNGTVDPGVKPRLFTFYQGDDDKWRFIAAAVFSVTQKVADHTDCIAATAE